MNILQQRKSHTSIGEIYFWTATIHKWFPLLDEDNNQQLIIDYLKKISDEGYLTIYGFILMPNHKHIIGKENKMNGKETPQGSFLKYTSREFLKKLKANSKSFSY